MHMITFAGLSLKCLVMNGEYQIYNVFNSSDSSPPYLRIAKFPSHQKVQLNWGNKDSRQIFL